MKPLILAEFPIKNDGRILFNQKVNSKEEGLALAEKQFGPFEQITVAEMPGVKTQDGRRFMIFYGQKELKLLARWLTDNLPS